MTYSDLNSCLTIRFRLASVQEEIFGKCLKFVFTRLLGLICDKHSWDLLPTFCKGV